jgi:hypothetical protein
MNQFSTFSTDFNADWSSSGPPAQRGRGNFRGGRGNYRGGRGGGNEVDAFGRSLREGDVPDGPRGENPLPDRPLHEGAMSPAGSSWRCG